MADNRKDEPNREATKLCFEFFKHFTTISTTVALVELALVQFFKLDSSIVGVGLLASLITLLLSIVGMLIVAIPASITGEVPETGVGTYLLMVFTALIFFAGLLTFALSATSPPGVDSNCLFAPPFC